MSPSTAIEALEEIHHRLKDEIDFLSRRYRDLGLWDDYVNLKKAERRLWDIEEAIRIQHERSGA